MDYFCPLNVLKNEGSKAKFPYNPLGYCRDRPDRALFREIMVIIWEPHVRIEHVDNKQLLR